MPQPTRQRRARSPEVSLALAIERGYLQRVMPNKIALLFAGQGAQSVGMGRDLSEQFLGAAELFQLADKILERKLS